MSEGEHTTGTVGFGRRMVDSPALVSALISGVALAILGFGAALFTQIVTYEALKKSDEEYLAKMQSMFESANNKVLAQATDQANKFIELSGKLGEARAGAEAASRQAQNAAGDASSAADRAKQSLNQVERQLIGKIADDILKRKDFLTSVAGAADVTVKRLSEDASRMRSALARLSDYLIWTKVTDAEDFDIHCQYKLRVQSWLNEAIRDKTNSTEFDVLATKVSTENITATFVGGPLDVVTIGLIVEKGSKTTATEVVSAPGVKRTVIVMRRCPADGVGEDETMRSP